MTFLQNFAACSHISSQVNCPGFSVICICNTCLEVLLYLPAVIAHYSVTFNMSNDSI